MEGGAGTGKAFEIDEGVLDFAEGDEEGLAVFREGFVAAADGGVEVGADFAAVEDGSGDACAEGEDAVFPVEEAGDIEGFEASAGGEDEVRVECGFGDADAGVGGAEVQLGGADVGAAGKDFRGESRADGGKGDFPDTGGKGKRGRTRAAEDGEGVLGSAALALDKGKVVFREFHLGGGATGGEAVDEAGVGLGFLDVERFGAAGNGVADDGFLSVEPTEDEILTGDLAGEAKALGIEQRLGGGGLGGGCLHLAAIAAPKVGVVGEIEGAAVAFLLEIDLDAGREISGDAVGGATGNAGGTREIESGEKFRAVHADEGAGGIDTSFGGGEVVVGGEGAIDEAVEIAFLEKTPPLVGKSRAGDGLGFLP